jgi:imidazole glycerol phosphate synthase subunit HisF
VLSEVAEHPGHLADVDERAGALAAAVHVDLQAPLASGQEASFEVVVHGGAGGAALGFVDAVGVGGGEGAGEAFFGAA